jgi:hypothetical protein
MTDSKRRGTRVQGETLAPAGRPGHPPPAPLRLNAWLAAGICFGLALLYFLPALMPGRGIFGTDYLAGSYPFFDFMAERFRSLALPRWVPHVYGGVPLFASPGSGFYPFWLLLALVLPVGAILPILFVVQFGLAGLGVYLLLRELDVRPWIALTGGVAFQFTGLTASYVYAGHDGRIIVATLAPLFLFFLHRLVRTGGLPWAAGSAATLAFSLLSFQIQSNYYLLLAGLGWGIFALWSLRVRGRALVARLALAFGAVVVAFALSAVNFLPFLNYVDASPRGGEEGRGWEYATSWAMPPSDLSALFVPELEGASVVDPNTGEPQFPEYRGANPFKLHTEYVGAFVLLLLGLGAWYSRRDRYWWFFLGLSLFTLTIAFGGHTPFYRVYYALLPGTRLFRAPSIAFFLVPLSLAAMAGLTLERMARLLETEGRRGQVDELRHGRIATLAAAGLGVVLLLVAAATDDPGRAAGIARFAVFLALIAGGLWLWLAHRIASRVLAIALVVLTVTDLWIIGQRFLHTVPPPRVWFQADDVIHALRSQPGQDRVWVLPVGPQYHGSGNYLMLHGLDQAGGEHPNPLQRWYEYVGEGEGHYVNWSHFLGESPTYRQAANIRWIVSLVGLEGAEQFAGVRLVHGGPSALIYEDPAALPRTYLVGDVRVSDHPDGALAILADPAFDPRREAVVHEMPRLEPGGGAVDGEVRVVTWEAETIRLAVRSDRPALLVVADNFYPGWRATVNGQQEAILRTNHTFRGVVVPPGEHDVVFEFAPARLFVGFGIYLAGLLLLAGYGLFLGFRRWRGPAPAP